MQRGPVDEFLDAIAAATDWSQIVALYDQLYAMRPNAVTALNRAVAIGETAWRDRRLRPRHRADRQSNRTSFLERQRAAAAERT